MKPDIQSLGRDRDGEKHPPKPRVATLHEIILSYVPRVLMVINFVILLPEVSRNAQPVFTGAGAALQL